MNRSVTYSWRLREIMAARGLNNISDLIPLLKDRSIDLSASQIYRLVGQRPERLSLALLGALCDALECSVEDLCRFEVQTTQQPRRAASGGPTVIDLNSTIRPRRARVRRTD